MVAWKNAVIINTAAGYRAFLTQYPDSDAHQFSLLAAAERG